MTAQLHALTTSSSWPPSCKRGTGRCRHVALNAMEQRLVGDGAVRRRAGTRPVVLWRLGILLGLVAAIIAAAPLGSRQSSSFSSGTPLSSFTSPHATPWDTPTLYEAVLPEQRARFIAAT